MYKNLLRTTAMVCAIFGTACSQTETALMDDPDQSPAQQSVESERTKARIENQPPKKLEAAHNDRPKYEPEHTHAIAQQVVQTTPPTVAVVPSLSRGHRLL